MNTFQRDLDDAAERARRFFADARAADRRPGDLASAALSLSEVLVSLAFRSERSLRNNAPPTVETPVRPRLAVFSPETSDAEPTILRFDAFRPTSRTVDAPQPEPKREPTLKIFAADAEPPRRAAFPRLFASVDERPRLRVVAAD
ncbi:MAG: hypothetical protein IJ991_09615 [Thermoguttaceae bacterium]|nr:hypothetical protein [Thermoguttaceae bacterium]